MKILRKIGDFVDKNLGMVIVVAMCLNALLGQVTWTMVFCSFYLVYWMQRLKK